MYADKFALIFLITHLYQPCKNPCPLVKVCSLGGVFKVKGKRKALLPGCIDQFCLSTHPSTKYI